jgi:Uma2 family endonuclease
MASITRPSDKPDEPSSLPPLRAGDRLDQPTFHARYEAMPEDFRAELIGGVVHVPSPLKRPHSRAHLRLLQWLAGYEKATPGTEAHDNASTLLGRPSEAQPDACLLILPAGLGQTRNVDDYIVGPPEFIGEVASSTEAIDLHGKRSDYERAGVKEYLVVALRQARVFWFVSREGAFVDLAGGADGILRSEVFPGLWLDPAALLRLDEDGILEVLRQGLATPEHAAFVTRLAGPAGSPPP